jgi:hypothetical protein
MSALCWRSLALWLLGYPEAALTDADQALRGAREMSQAVTLMFAQVYASVIHICCGIYDAANAQLDEVGALADVTPCREKILPATILRELRT